MLRSRAVRRLLARLVLSLLLLAILLIAGSARLPASFVAPLLRSSKSVLWVIAHPDDESFFFAPSIIGLRAASPSIHASILCLSVGNHDGLGEVRRAELLKSCSQLNIPSERCIALDLPSLPDSPAVWWAPDEVASIVRNYIEQWDVDAVISFDQYGVSGHANHQALGSALAEVVRFDRKFPPVFAVHSTNLLAKFSSFLFLPVAVARHFARRTGSSSSLFINSWAQYRQTRRSFSAHASQARWFRTLFVSFSRYLWFVRLERVLP
ncbi:hypothetical protein JCM8547_002025 [Rhodosporidiobolus lusitaniae]